MSGPPSRITERDRRIFLAKVAEGETLEAAATAAGRSRRAFSRLREADSEFANAVEDAIESGTDRLEDEARRRAMGYHETTVDKNGNERTVTRYSDLLLIFLLKARRPEKFRDNQHSVDLGGSVHVGATVTHPDVAQAIERFTETVRSLSARQAPLEGGPAPAQLPRRAGDEFD